MVFGMSNLNNEIVFEGWLTKSPPTKRLWKARWRRRWFVLKHSGELPGQFFLLYYTDKNCRKLKGTIDLDQCEQVDAGLRFQNSKENFPHLFSVKTPKRTYYLAAESENEMNKWVDCICQVCGFRIQVNDSSIEIIEEPADSLSRELESIDRNTNKMVKKTEPTFERSYALSIYDARQTPSASPTSSVSGPYIPISECHSGKPLNTPKGMSDFNNIISRQGLTHSKYNGKDCFAQSFTANLPRPGVKQTICADDISKSNVSKPIALPIAVQTKPPIYERHNSLYDDRTNPRPRREDKITNIESAKKMAEMRKEATTDEFYDSPRKVVVSDVDRPATAPIPNWDTFPGDNDGDFSPGDIGSWSVVERFGKLTVVDSKLPIVTNSLNRAHKQPKGPVDTFSLRRPANVAVAPPRPPKSRYLKKTYEPDSEQYVNIAADDAEKVEEGDQAEAAPSPSASAVTSDETYDIPRSHQPPDLDLSQNKDAYTNAMPVQGLQGNVFRYDFTEIGAANPSASGEPLSPRFETSYVNMPSPIDTPTPPAVNRELKPARKMSDSGASSEPSPGPFTPSLGPITPSGSGEPSPLGFVPPSIDRTLKPKKLSSASAASFKLSRPPDGNLVMRRVRAGPSPTPPNPAGMHIRSRSENYNGDEEPEPEQIYFYDHSSGFFKKEDPPQIQYLDLDLDSDASGQSPGISGGSPGPSGPSSTPYKTIDFLKTRAFNMTREEADKKRKGGKSTD